MKTRRQYKVNKINSFLSKYEDVVNSDLYLINQDIALIEPDSHKRRLKRLRTGAIGDLISSEEFYELLKRLT